VARRLVAPYGGLGTEALDVTQRARKTNRHTAGLLFALMLTNRVRPRPSAAIINRPLRFVRFEVSPSIDDLVHRGPSRLIVVAAQSIVLGFTKPSEDPDCLRPTNGFSPCPIRSPNLSGCLAPDSPGLSRLTMLAYDEQAGTVPLMTETVASKSTRTQARIDSAPGE